GKGKEKKKNDKKSKGKSEYLAPKAGIVKQKFQGTCYNYDQPGHRDANCKMPKQANPRQENMVNVDVDMIAMVSDVVAMISERLMDRSYIWATLDKLAQENDTWDGNQHTKRWDFTLKSSQKKHKLSDIRISTLAIRVLTL
ncbi:hypothetical protein Tco_0325742, partial [Tanacetum coccineum]